MTEPHDPGPGESRGIAGRLVYDPSFATADEATFNELVALMRDGAPRNAPVEIITIDDTKLYGAAAGTPLRQSHMSRLPM